MKILGELAVLAAMGVLAIGLILPVSAGINAVPWLKDWSGWPAIVLATLLVCAGATCVLAAVFHLIKRIARLWAVEA